MNVYGDISPRTAAFAARQLLARALPEMCAGRYGQQATIPRNKTSTIKWRRYNAFPVSTVPLVEGVTPAPDMISFTDVTAVLQQFGRRVVLTDVIQDTHEDPVLNEYTGVLGELAGQTQETIIFNAIKAGTNVLYPGAATSRATVASAPTTTLFNRALRQLERQNTKYVKGKLAASDKVGTTPIPPCFIGLCHPDLRTDYEGLTGWKQPQEYGSGEPLENEIGSYKRIRFLQSTIYAPWAAAGASGSTLLTNGGSGTGNADVYPIVITGRDAYATVALAGADAVTPIVVNAKPSDSDPLGQRAHVAFKMDATAAILNDAWMVRCEAGVTQ